MGRAALLDKAASLGGGKVRGRATPTPTPAPTPTLTRTLTLTLSVTLTLTLTLTRTPSPPLLRAGTRHRSRRTYFPGTYAAEVRPWHDPWHDSRAVVTPDCPS